MNENLNSSVRKRLLIVSYHFPPDAAVGSVRPAKFAKYLQLYGWTPVVLTIKKRYYERLDLTKTEEVKEIPTFRTIKIPTISDIYLAMKNVYLKKIKLKNLDVEKQKWVPQRKRLSVRKEGIFWKLHRYINSLIISLPDGQVGWVLPASIKGLSLMRKYKIDAILTTGPPHSVHLIGMILKILSGKPWITDFRDPWSIDHKPFYSRSKPADSINMWLIRKVIQRSDYVVSVTVEMSEMFKKHYQDVPKEKFHTIWNGYDSEDIGKCASINKYNKFTITYTGTLYLSRDPATLLSALSDLIREGRVDRNNIQVRFIGNCRYVEGQSVEKMAADLGLQGLVAVIDPLPRHQALEEVAKSHALLLFPGQPWSIPVKLFEYIGLRSYIIAVCGEGATMMNLLKEYPKAIIVPPNDLEQMKKAITTLLSRRYNNYEDVVDNFPYKTFERRDLARRLAILLDRLTEKFS